MYEADLADTSVIVPVVAIAGVGFGLDLVLAIVVGIVLLSVLAFRRRRTPPDSG